MALFPENLPISVTAVGLDFDESEITWFLVYTTFIKW